MELTQVSNNMDTTMNMPDLPTNGITQAKQCNVSKVLSFNQEDSDDSWFDHPFFFSEHMPARDFKVLSKAQLEMGLSDGIFDYKKGAIEEDFTTAILNDCMHEIMQPSLAKNNVPQPRHTALYPAPNLTKTAA